MRISIMIYYLFFLNFSVMAAENFTITISPGGFFDVNYRMTLSGHESLDDMFIQTFVDESNQKLINADLVSQKASINLEKALLENGTYEFILSTQARRMGLTASIKNSCKIKVTKDQILQACVIAESSLGILGKIFHSGSSTINCLKKNEIVCDIKLKGQAREINALLFSRSADRLAISGSIKTVTELHMSYLLQTQNSHTASNTFSSNFNLLWDKMMNKLDSKERLKSSFTVRSQDTGVATFN